MMDKICLATLTLTGFLFITTPAVAQNGHQQHLDPSDYCQVPPEQRLSLVGGAIRSAWYDLDVHGRATLARISPHSAQFGLSPLSARDPMRARMERYKERLQHLMALMGALFPQYSRPSDGERLVERFATRSVPAYGTAAEHQIVAMEQFLSGAQENRALGIAFVEALHALEGSTLALASGQPAPAFHDQNSGLKNAFEAFMPALKTALFAPGFETALGRRMTSYCDDILSERDQSE
ncbi:hypothetical protein [Sphingopyxis sp. P8]|uniref:hypothetical protein n=2 Tax=Sphingopyxis TaxID=165697 RepID=UPI001D09ECFB|nr:hypothetical protein [Sphingopyxis sp. P8]